MSSGTPPSSGWPRNLPSCTTSARPQMGTERVWLVWGSVGSSMRVSPLSVAAGPLCLNSRYKKKLSLSLGVRRQDRNQRPRG